MQVNINDSNPSNYVKLVAGGYKYDGSRIDLVEGELIILNEEIDQIPVLSNELISFNTQLEDTNRRVSLLSMAKGYGLNKLGSIVVPFKANVKTEKDDIISQGILIYTFIPTVLKYSTSEDQEPFMQKFPNDYMLEYNYTSVYILNSSNNVAVEMTVENKMVWQNHFKSIKLNYIPSINDDMISTRSIDETKFKRVVSIAIVGDLVAANTAQLSTHISTKHFEHDGLVAKLWNELRSNITPSSTLVDLLYTGNKICQINGNIVCKDFTKYFIGSPIEY